MTIKEVAELLGVTKQAITKHVKELYPIKLNHGITTHLFEEEITEIKRHMLQTTRVVSVSTDLDMQEKAFEVMQWMKSKIKVLKDENEQMKPKAISYDTFMSTENVHSMGEVAKMFREKTGRNKLFALLRENGVLMKNNEPYQQYVDNGYFLIKQKVIATGESLGVTMVTSRGVVYIEKLLKRMD